MNRQSFWRRPQSVLPVALLFAMGALALGAVDHFAHAPLALKMANADEGPSRTGFAPMVKRVVPAVVNISSSKVIKTSASSGELPDDPFFRQFFGNGSPFGNQRQMPEQREQGLGSGVIMTPDGYILTNNHVVDGASDVRVTLKDKREFKARVIGTDPKSDLAVLKIDATNLPCITVGNSSNVGVGDYALAIGDPFGVGQTVTMGIVSATGRSNLGIETYEDFIQTDAPINPGNSGGALVDDRGELIGINTAIISHGSEGNQGIGFAIPSDMAVNVMQQIVKNGKVERAYLGILPQDVTPAIAKAFSENGPDGALVGDVTPNSPASRSGLEKGDIVLEVNGKPVADSNDLRMKISMMAPGSEANLKIFRQGAEREVPVRLAELPTKEASAAPLDNGSNDSELSGVSVDNLDGQTAHDLGLPANTQGVVVTKVNPSSEAAAAGLQRGDVIQEVNRKPVTNTSDFARAMRGSRDETLLLVNRNGNTMYLAV